MDVVHPSEHDLLIAGTRTPAAAGDRCRAFHPTTGEVYCAGTPILTDRRLRGVLGDELCAATDEIRVGGGAELSVGGCRRSGHGREKGLAAPRGYTRPQSTCVRIGR